MKGTTLSFAVDMGAELLYCGAEIRRVEETMELILKSYGYDSCSVSATHVNIVATVSEKDGEPLTKTMRIKGKDTNLHRLELLNALSRKICETKPDIYVARKELEKIRKEKGSGLLAETIAFAAVGLSYSLSLGGSIGDMLTALFSAAITRIILFFLEKQRFNNFFTSIIAAALIAVITSLSSFFGFCMHSDIAMTGALITLVPGIALTNCMRDFMSEDYLSGISGLSEAILTASGIAIGVAVVFFAKGALI